MYSWSVIEDSKGPIGEFCPDGLTTLQCEVSSEVAGSAGWYAVAGVYREAQFGLTTSGLTYRAVLHDEPLIGRVRARLENDCEPCS